MNSKHNGVHLSAVKSLVVFLGSLLITGLVTGQDISALDIEVVNLEYKEEGFYSNGSAEVWTDGRRFEKEPDFGERSIVRGLLRTGTEEKDHIGFAWDRSEGKLYLELNRNGDLTDDPEGIFESGQNNSYQNFHDIHLKTTGDTQLEYVVDIAVYQFTSDRVHCSITVKSGFRGQFELHGGKWDLAVVDNMDGRIDSGDQIFLAPVGSGLADNAAESRLSLYAPEVVTFGGYSYNTSFQLRSDQDRQSLDVEFAQTECSTGQLKLEGEFIERLTLVSGFSAVLIDSPGQTVSVPAGNYRLEGVYLDGGEAGLFIAKFDSGRHERVAIDENQTTTLKIGGPLASSVEVNPLGRTLRMVYSLKGVGGYEYQALNESRENPPEFVVKKDGKEVASGNFEYG